MWALLVSQCGTARAVGVSDHSIRILGAVCPRFVAAAAIASRDGSDPDVDRVCHAHPRAQLRGYAIQSSRNAVGLRHRRDFLSNYGTNYRSHSFGGGLNVEALCNSLATGGTQPVTQVCIGDQRA